MVQNVHTVCCRDIFNMLQTYDFHTRDTVYTDTLWKQDAIKIIMFIQVMSSIWCSNLSDFICLDKSEISVFLESQFNCGSRVKSKAM